MNIEYDYREDSKCGDPDVDSPKLYDVHKILWNRILPNKQYLNLKRINNSGRLLLKNNLIDNLSSDRMCPHFVGKYNGKFEGWISEIEEEKFKQKVRTIGGHIIFPAHKKEGFTINQARGVNRKICDRFDLTLECIKRFYENKKSPLYETFKRYSEFFNLFIDFNGFVDFFLLQDFVDENYQVLFPISFNDFERDPLPLNVEEYRNYRSFIIEQIDKRNLKILNTYKSMIMG